jgi:tetratricopeptide (TPR) repeat protein
MVFKRYLLYLGMMVTAFSGYSQKLKYKDIFNMLQQGQYDQVEPFLKKFVKDNPDHPNALLSLGTLFQEKSSKNDYLKQTGLLQHNMDSAILYYEKSLKEIDEREVRKNSEFYESYSRRDQRTGTYGIKFSDVQYEINKHIQGLKEKKERVDLLNKNFNAATNAYAHAQKLYGDIQKSFTDERELLFQSNDSSIHLLRHLASAYDSCQTAFKEYKSISQLIGKTGYNQVLDIKEIKDFKKDGTSPVDFMSGNPQIWNYKTWSENIIQAIEKEIKPVRESLIAYDMMINKLRERVKKDSVGIQPEIDKLVKTEPDLSKFDPSPLPSKVFRMKIAELKYGSSLSEHRPFRDSANVGLRLRSVATEIKLISALDSLANLLVESDMDKESGNYKDFITSAYGTVDVLKSLARTTMEFAKREKLKKQEEGEAKAQSLKWVVFKNDSIPLFTDAMVNLTNFRPLIIVSEDHTLGLEYIDSVATGYFYTITPSRIPDVSARFPVDKAKFNKRNLPIIKGVTTRDEKGLVYYGLICSEAKIGGKHPVVVAKIYRSDGLAWSHTYQFELLPSAMTFEPSSGELSIKTSNPEGEIKIVVLDKNGKQLQ